MKSGFSYPNHVHEVETDTFGLKNKCNLGNDNKQCVSMRFSFRTVYCFAWGMLSTWINGQIAHHVAIIICRLLRELQLI